MKKYKKEIVKLVARELFLSFFDLVVQYHTPGAKYRRSTRNYMRQRGIERKEFNRKLDYWQKRGYINRFIEKKEEYVELTPRGIDRFWAIAIEDLQIKRPKKWDGKFRVVIFDIKEKSRSSRDALRHKLRNLGFFQIQKSVYAFPFECANEIGALARRLLIDDSVLIMISDIIQGEEKILNFFLENGILLHSDLVL